jgi:hypothetical protein
VGAAEAAIHAIYALLRRITRKICRRIISQALARDLRSQEAVFDFKVQLQTDPVGMPVEDVSVEWDENASNPVTVATLRIPPQKVDGSDDLATGCETMSFNPWHALAEHRPMGRMNRLRKVVYQASIANRAEHSLAQPPPHGAR